MKLYHCAASLALVAAAACSQASITVTVNNNQPEGGFTFSPLWFAFQDGSFDGFNAAAGASAGIRNLAELGDSTGYNAEFMASGANGQSGVLAHAGGLPQFTPGDTGSITVNVAQPSVRRYFSFGAMIVPSNDFFMANDNPTAWQVFDAAGNFAGPLLIRVFAADSFDAGTETNNINNGPAFIVGQDPAAGTQEDGVITPLFDVPSVDVYMASIVDKDTPIGPITHTLFPADLIASIRITPEPGTLGCLALGALVGLRRIRR